MTDEVEFIKALQSEKDVQVAFKQLVTQYKEPLYWHIRRIVLNHDDADDVLQNVFIKVFNNINKFQGDSTLYTSLYRIATNESLTFISRKAKRGNITSAEVNEIELNKLESDVYFEGDAIQLALQKAIAQLPEKQRLVFTMKYFEEHTFEDLSEILGTSVGGLKSSYHIAVKKIISQLKQD